MANNSQGAQLLSSMTPAQRKAVMDQIFNSQKAVTQDAYYSEVMFNLVIAAGVGTISAGSRKAFAYKQGDQLAGGNAGYPAGDTTIADDRHTNITAPGQTVDGQKVYVYGLSILPRSDSDAFLLTQLAPQIVCRVNFGTKSSFGLGAIETIPGAGGLVGVGMSKIVDPPQNESFSTRVSAMQMGIAHRKNFRELKSPFTWNPQSIGSDANMNVELRLPANYSYTLPTARSAGTAISAYVQPTASIFLKLLVHLHAVQIADRGVNS